MRAYLTKLDQAIPDPKGVRCPTAKAISPTDPAAAVTSGNGRLRFAYAITAMVGTGSGMALDVGAAPARTADEPRAERLIVERMRAPWRRSGRHGHGRGRRLGRRPPSSAGPGDRGILHAPVEKTRLAGERCQSPKADFRYDDASDSYLCPALKTCGRRGADEQFALAAIVRNLERMTTLPGEASGAEQETA